MLQYSFIHFVEKKPTGQMSTPEGSLQLILKSSMLDAYQAIYLEQRMVCCHPCLWYGTCPKLTDKYHRMTSWLAFDPPYCSFPPATHNSTWFSNHSLSKAPGQTHSQLCALRMYVYAYNEILCKQTKSVAN